MTMRCGVCGKTVSLREWLSALLTRGRVTYPFRTSDRRRRESSVRWICGNCQERARQIRKQEVAT
jgi:hypothetical protein